MSMCTFYDVGTCRCGLGCLSLLENAVCLMHGRDITNRACPAVNLSILLYKLCYIHKTYASSTLMLSLNALQAVAVAVS